MAPLDPASSAGSQIRYANVASALKNDKGSKAEISTLESNIVVNLGDNHASKVSSVLVSYILEGTDGQVSYITKENNMHMDSQMQKVLFQKEIGFYRNILPLLNKELTGLNLEKLRMPAFFYGDDKLSEEIVILENLCTSGFKIGDRVTVMDEHHTKVVLAELARMHAASVILMSVRLQGTNMVESYPSLRELYVAFQEETMMKTKDFLPKNVEAGIAIGHKCGYIAVCDYLSSIKKNCYELLLEQFSPSEKFNVICHGDCWASNFLFRYDEDGSVQECRLIDLQNTRLGSPALDLNYLFYCSLSAAVRRPHLDAFLGHYYATFASVMAAANCRMRFTLDELKQEFKDKNLFGLLMAIMVVPCFVMSPDDSKQLHEKSLDEWKEFVIERASDESALLKSRFEEIFEDMVKSGCIKKVSRLLLALQRD